jgi:cell division protein FtsL
MQRTLVALLAGLLFACSLLLVGAQHRARGLFIDLERAQQQARQLEAEGNRMRIDLGRAAQPAAVEAAARGLGLQPIDSQRTVFLPGLPAAVAAPAPTSGSADAGGGRP